MMRLPPDIDPGPFEPDTVSDRKTIRVVLSLFFAGMAACVLAFLALR